VAGETLVVERTWPLVDAPPYGRFNVTVAAPVDWELAPEPEDPDDEPPEMDGITLLAPALLAGALDDAPPEHAERHRTAKATSVSAEDFNPLTPRTIIRNAGVEVHRPFEPTGVGWAENTPKMREPRGSTWRARGQENVTKKSITASTRAW